MSPVVLFAVISLISLVSALTYTNTYCRNTTVFPSSNSAMRSDINSLLFNLFTAANHSSTPGFHYSAVGTPAVYGLYMCRGDADAATCRLCVEEASEVLYVNCPLASQAVVWYEECMIRYSNASFFSQLADDVNVTMWNNNNITGDTYSDERVLLATLNNVAKKAASGNSMLKFTTEMEVFDGPRMVYVMGQCTPDLLSKQLLRLPP